MNVQNLKFGWTMFTSNCLRRFGLTTLRSSLMYNYAKPYIVKNIFFPVTGKLLSTQLMRKNFKCFFSNQIIYCITSIKLSFTIFTTYFL